MIGDPTIPDAEIRARTAALGKESAMSEKRATTRRLPNGREVPVILPLPPEEPYEPNPVVAICGQCGIELRKVMMYCCMNSRCPVQPRVTCSL